MAWFSDNDLRQLAGFRSYSAGQDYVREVSGLECGSAEATATVHGTAPYQVRLSNRDGALGGDCSCLWAQEGNFCKHCVAVGLAVLANVPVLNTERQPAPELDKEPRDDAGVGAYLASASRAELADLVTALAAQDQALRRRLELRAAGAGPAPAELDALISALHLHDATDPEPMRYARESDAALRMLSQLGADHPRLVGVAYLQALRQAARTEDKDEDEYDDDEYDDDQTLSAARLDVLKRLVAGFASVCRADPPDPERLASLLIELALDSPGSLDIPLGEFGPALGARGLAAYARQLSEQAATDSDDDDEPDGESRPERLIRLRTAYLEFSGDVSGLVAHYAETLPEPGRYLRIGEVLCEAGRPEEAIAWLRRGQGDGGYEGIRIRDRLARVYADTGQPAEALRVRWDSFTCHPGESAYRSLLQEARRAGTAAEVKDRAMALLYQKAERGNADTLVSVLLATGETDEAWAAAHRFRCSSTYLFNAAKIRGRTHPADAIPVYKQEVEDAIARTDKNGYRQAALLLSALKDQHQRAGLDFAPYLSEVKAANRRRTSLMAELAAAGL